MAKQLPELLQAPLFPESPEKTRIARLLNALILLIFTIVFLALVIGVPFIFFNKTVSLLLVSYLLLTCAFCWVEMRSGRLKTASVILVVNVYLIAIVNSYIGGGIASNSFILFAPPVVISTLLLEFRWSFVSTLFAFSAISTFAYLDWSGVEIPKVVPGLPLGTWILYSLVLWLLFLAVRLSVKGWNQALDRACWELEERHRTEAERDKLKEQLFQSRKMESLGRMAGGVAHDFNNLLAVMVANFELMKRHPGGPEGLEAEMADMDGALQSAKKMTKSLLDFSKKREMRLEKLEMDALIREVRPVLENLLGENAQLELKLAAPGAIVMADRSGMDQVLQNLVVNARHAMEKGGRLVIQTGAHEAGAGLMDPREGKYLVINVRDNGSGMSRETKEKIFEPFFTTKGKGTGLGLTTAFGVIKQQGGFIEVDSEQGKGTEFRIYLPQA